MRKPRGSSIVMPVIDPEPAPSLLRFVTLQCVEGEQDLAGLARAFGPHAMANGFLGVLRHQLLQLGFGRVMIEIGTPGPAKHAGEFRPDPLYQHLLLTAEKKFWRCVETGETPHLFDVEPPRPRVEAIRVVDMSSSNSQYSSPC